MVGNLSRDDEFQIELTKRQFHGGIVLAMSGTLIAIGFGILIAPVTPHSSIEPARPYAILIMFAGLAFVFVAGELVKRRFRLGMVKWLDRYEKEHPCCHS